MTERPIIDHDPEEPPRDRSGNGVYWAAFAPNGQLSDKNSHPPSAVRKTMRGFALSLLAAPIICFLGQSSAYAYNGNWVWNFCSKDDAYLQNGCTGILTGVTFTLLWINKSDDFPEKFCPPEPLSTSQLVDVLMNYLKNNPELRHHPIGAIGYIAFLEAFPCKDK